jgi:uncharacterized protein with PQ loop repeat
MRNFVAIAEPFAVSAQLIKTIKIKNPEDEISQSIFSSSLQLYRLCAAAYGYATE